MRRVIMGAIQYKGFCYVASLARQIRSKNYPDPDLPGLNPYYKQIRIEPS